MMAGTRNLVVTLSTDLTALEQNSASKNHFLKIPNDVSADEIVSTACNRWQIDAQDHNNYCLIFEDSKKYLTEDTKSELSASGVPSILKLNWKPEIKASNLVNLLKEKENNQMYTWVERVAHCKALEEATADPVVCKEVIKNDGLQAVIKYMTYLSSCPYSRKTSTDTTSKQIDPKFQVKAHLMKAMERLICVDPSLLLLEEIHDTLATEMVHTLETDTTSSRDFKLSANIVATALFVLESLADIHIKENAEGTNELEDKLWLPVKTVFNLMKFYHGVPKILVRVIQAFNSIYFMANEKVRAEMVKGYSEQKISDFVYEKVVREEDITKGTIRNELQEMQSNILNGFYGPLLKKDGKDQQTIRKRLEMMRKEIFETTDQDSEESKVEQFDIMGCSNAQEPWCEFQESPSGKLALYLIFYFNNRHKKSLKQIIEANECKAVQVIGCPLIASSLKLVELLCELLSIKEAEIPVGYRKLKYRKYQHNEGEIEMRYQHREGQFVPMFYSNQEFLGEMFSICMQHYQKTWKDMRGTKMEDIKKVINVIKQQLCGTPESSLRKAPLTLKVFEELIKRETYGKVKDTWAEEANKIRDRSQPMKDLKEILQPRIEEQIKTQRLAALEHGTRFYKFKKDGGGKERGKEVYCKLDASHKTLHYKDINEGDKDPDYEELLTDETSIPVSNIEGLRTGMELLAPGGVGGGVGGVGGMGDNGDIFNYAAGLAEMLKGAEKAFAITYKKEVDYARRHDGNANEQHSLMLLAKDKDPNEHTFDVWCDGINLLIENKEKRSSLFEDELKQHLNIEVRMNLLNPSDTFNFESLPTPPPPPTNYNFASFKFCPETKNVIKKET